MPGNANRRGVTLRDVADRVGVSVSAVSMALADHPRIGSAVKQEVRAVAAELGYVTNSAARALRAQRSGAIALIIPDTGQHIFGHAYFMHLLFGVSEVVNARGASLLLSTATDERAGVSAYERVLRSGAADGAIVASAAIDDPNVERLVSGGLPVVVVGHFPHLPDAVSVGVDDVAGARSATEHLLAVHAVRRLAHVAGPLDHQTAIDRLAGYREAMSAAGLEVDEDCVVEGDFTEESGRAAAARLLERRPDVEAVFAANDEMAYGVMVEARHRGRSIPGDLRLVGYDDFGVSRLTTPAITTVTVPAVDVGRRVTARLFDLVEAEHAVATHDTLPVHLTVRGSCGCTPG